MHRFCLLDGGQDQGSSLHVMEMGATVANQDALVEWALQEEEDNIDEKNKGKERSTRIWRSLWTCLVASILDRSLARRIMEALAADSCDVKLRTSHIHNEACYSK